MKAWERRQAILEALCVRRHDTRANLAQEFGVCKRTIEYDIVELSLHYPIYTTQGGAGGIHVMDGFYLTVPRRLTQKQTALLHRLLPTMNGEDHATLLEIIHTYSGRGCGLPRRLRGTETASL